MFLFLIILSLFLSLIWLYIRHCRKWGPLKKIPGPSCYPIIGNLPMFMGSVEELTKKMLSLNNFNNRLIKLWSGPFPFVVILNAEDAELIFKSSKDIGKAKEYKYWRALVGDSLFAAPYGPKFRRTKKIIMPSFGTNNIKSFIGIFNKQTENLIKNLKNKITGGVFDIHTDLSECLMNILLESVLGYSKNDLQKKSHVITDTLNRLAKRGIGRQFKFWMGPDFLFWLLGYKKLQDRDLQYMNEVVLDKIIRERCENKKRNDREKLMVFIDALLDTTDGPLFTHKEIRDEVSTIIFAGQDTTSLALAFSLCLLGLDENVQEKLYEEIVQTVGKNNPDITYDKLREMVYLGQVIQETLRLYPSGPVVGKVALNDIKLTDGQIIPKDTTIAISIYHIQRNRDYYPDPDKFDPDNFTPERIGSRHPFSYIPFSGGTRTCVGQTYSYIVMKLILAKIVLNFKIYSKIKQEDFRLSWDMTLKRSDGFPVSLESRSTNDYYIRG